MTNAPNESEDSRTFVAGRKRDLQELNRDEEIQNSTDESDQDADEERGPKRVKEDHGPLESKTSRERVTSIASLGVPAPSTSEVATSQDALGERKSGVALPKDEADIPKNSQLGIQPLASIPNESGGDVVHLGVQAASAPSAPAVTWNKGIQSGLRTSFSRKVRLEEPQNLSRRLLEDDDGKAQQHNANLNQSTVQPKEFASGDQPIRPLLCGPPAVSSTIEEIQDRVASFEKITRKKLGRMTERERADYNERLEIFQADKEEIEMRQRLANLSKRSEADEASSDKMACLWAVRGRRLTRAEFEALDPQAKQQHQIKDMAFTESKKHSCKTDDQDQMHPEYQLGPATRNAAAIIAQFGWPLPEEQSEVLDQIRAGKTLYPSSKGVRGNLTICPKIYANWKIRELLDYQGKPISVKDFSYNVFAPLFLEQNQQNLSGLSNSKVKKLLIRGFDLYVKNFYKHTESSSWLLATATSTYAFTLDEVKRLARLEGLPSGSRRSPAVTYPTDDFTITGGDDNSAKEVFDSDSSEVDSITSAQLDVNDQEMDVDLETAEAVLVQKYFPSSTSAEPICLSCAKKGHRTLNCPARYCSTCGKTGMHTKNACPQDRRCGKCRERGHKTAVCPEKLGLAKTEAVPCDLCGSNGHTEVDCDYIWRSFDPRPEEIVTVRDIPIYCYSCGGSGHYGPRCGINRNTAFDGGFTWSTKNVQRYVDPNSNNRPLRAGVEYSIPARPSGSNGKAFSIKGQANNPITLDDSEEESFIHPKVQSGNGQRRQIQFGNPNNQHSSKNSRLPAPGLPPRPPYPPPRQARPIFDRGSRDSSFYSLPSVDSQSHFGPPSYPPTGPNHVTLPLPRGPNPNRANQGNNNANCGAQNGPSKRKKKKNKQAQPSQGRNGRH